MRLLLDNNLSPRLVELLGAAGWDVVHVGALGLRAASDKIVLRTAHDDDRILVSFFHDYEEVRGQPLSARERRAAVAAAAWILAFNARWQAALIVHGVCDYATIALVQDNQDDYLTLSWH
jgi:hypothetical protein